METWNARHSKDGGNGAQLAPSSSTRAGRSSPPFAAAAGMVEVPLRGRDTFVSSRVRTWNSSEALPAGHA
jgi:hypothetical protein